MMNATSGPSITPSGIIVIMVNPPASTPTVDRDAHDRTKAPIMYGNRRLSCLR